MTTLRLPDPLTNPNAPGFTDVRMIDNYPIYRDRLAGGSVVTLASGAQYWSISLTYSELFPEEQYILSTSLLNCKHKGQPLMVLLPQYENFHTIGDPSSITIAAGQQGNNLTMQNYNLTGAPKAGDLFQLTNHSSKVYKITNVVLVGTILTLEVYPNLRVPTTGNEKPVFNGILFQTVLAKPEAVESTFTSDRHYSGFTLELEEHVTNG